MIRVFRISQKKICENGEIVRFLWYFMVFRKKDLWGAYGWTWDIVDFFMKSIHCPL